MAFKNISVILSANVTSFTAQMGAAASSTKQLGREINEVASRGSETVKRIGQTMVVTAALLAAALATAGGAAVRFEAQMRNVNSITHASEEEFRRTSDQVLDLSRAFPQSASTLAAGLYEIASSGFQGAEGLTVLRSASLGASAGLTTTDVAAKGITSVLNAYGLSAGKAADVTDILFQTVNLGVVTFEELASTIGDVVGSAAAAGVSFDQVGAGLATITLSGISAAEASTSLNQVFRALISPSDAMSEQLRALGYQSGVAALQALGLQGTMELLRETTGGNVEELIKLFPEIRGARGALALMANEGQNAAKVFAEITDEEARAGAAQRAFDEQSKSTAFQLGLLRSSAEAFGIELGRVVLPIVRSGVELFTGLLHGIADLPGPVTTLIGVVALLATSILGLGGGFLLLAPKITAARKLFDDLATTAPRLASGLQSAAIAAGAVTIALSLGALVLAEYARKKAEAAARTERFVAALESEQSGTEGATRALVVKELVESDARRTLLEFGLSTSQVADAILGEQDAVEAVAASLLSSLPATERTAEAQRLLVDALNGSDEAAGKLGLRFSRSLDPDTRRTGNAIVELARDLGALSDSNTEATVQVRETNEALEDTGEGSRKTRKDLAALDAMFRDSAAGAAELTDRQKELADALASFVDPIGVYRDALQAKERDERSSFSGGADAAEDAARRQEEAFEDAARARQQALDEQIAAEREAFDERRRIAELALTAAQRDLEARQKLTDREIQDRQRLLDIANRDIDRGLDAEREALADRTEAQRRAFEDERVLLDARHREEADALAQGVGETREAFQARKDLLDKRHRDEKAAFDARKRLADRALDDEKDHLQGRTDAARRAAEDQREALEVEAVARRRAFDDEKERLAEQAAAAKAAADEERAVMEDRQRDLERSLDAKDRAEKRNLEEQKRTNRAASGSWQDFTDDVKLSLAEYAAALEQRNRDIVNWRSNLVTVASRVGPDVAAQLAKLGIEAAPLVAQFATGTEEDVTRAADAMREQARLGAAGAAAEIEFGMAVAATKMSQGATATVESIAAALGSSQGKVFEAGAELGLGLISSILAGIAWRTAEAANQNPALFSTPGFDPNAIIQGFAEGGLRDAHIATRMLVRYAEPETGGEAYVPRFGSTAKAKETLATAAGWYGHRIVPMAAGGLWGVPFTAPAGVGGGIDYERLAAAMARHAGPSFGDIVVADARTAKELGRELQWMAKTAGR